MIKQKWYAYRPTQYQASKDSQLLEVTSSGLVHLQGYHPAWLDDRLLRTASLHKLFQISRTNSEVNQTRLASGI